MSYSGQRRTERADRPDRPDRPDRRRHTLLALSNATAPPREPVVETGDVTPAPAAGRRGMLAPTRGEHRALLAILAVAAALRVAWAIYAGRALPTTWLTSGDQFSYVHYGREMAAGRGYISYTTGTATSYYPIGYPALLAVVFWILGHTPLPDASVLAITLMHATFGTATVAFVFVIAQRCFGVRAGIVGAAVTALEPNLIYGVASFGVETTFVFFSMAALAILVDHDWSAGPPTARRMLAFGFVLGLSALVRPFSLPFLLGAAVLAVVARIHNPRVLAVGAACVVIPIAALATPWTIRNAVRFHAFVPFSTNLGDTLCMDRSMHANGQFRWAVEGCADPATPEVQRNEENTSKAIAFVREHPGKELELVGKRLVAMMEHDHSALEEVERNGAGPFLGRRMRHTLGLVADAFFFVLLAVAVVGAPLLATGWRARPERSAVLVAALVLFVIPLGLWGTPRFHVPLLPFLAIAAAGAIDAGVRRSSPPT